MRIAFLGLTITSSWGNGHATTYRSLCRALAHQGHSIVFVEKDVEWYRSNRDLPEPEFCELKLYDQWTELKPWLRREIPTWDAVILGSYFPDGIEAARLLFEFAPCPVLFYDIDTPITLSLLREHGSAEYVATELVPHFDAYLSFTGGPTLRELEQRYGARHAFPLYCSVDPERYRRTAPDPAFTCDMSYLGTYAADRQPGLEACMNGAARALPASSFFVAGPMYPPTLQWPPNVRLLPHVSPRQHPTFYSSARFTLNLTRKEMIRAGYSPSVRLFEAAACGAAIISDRWPGLDELFRPGSEILIATTTEGVVDILTGCSVGQSRAMGDAARERVLAEHSSSRRAQQLIDALAIAASRSRATLVAGCSDS